ncbi:hypothetical protein DNTS_017591 [Danionella cerebrum]|uniref:Uncharacterized protein n=1 Tax=Danionella cerebrum TaxID=2873325 RepID=A0A553N3D0_9TELE|nr:hypothetical protein DNTS_017591 [Danionella translucida]
MVMGVMEDRPAKAIASRAMEVTKKTLIATRLLTIRVDTAPAMDNPSQEDMDHSPPLNPMALGATVTAASLNQHKVEAMANSLLILLLPLVAMEAALSPQAMVSSRVRVAMVLLVVSLEDMGAVEDLQVAMVVVEAKLSTLNKGEGPTTNPAVITPLHLKTMDNKINTDREVTTRIVHH